MEAKALKINEQETKQHTCEAKLQGLPNLKEPHLLLLAKCHQKAWQKLLA